MTARSFHRGHAMHFDEAADAWRYDSDGSLVAEHWRDRPCGSCGVAFTENGHDPCIANLPHVQNACCGHGRESEAYVQLADGRTLRGSDAMRLFDEAQLRALRHGAS